MRRGHIIQIIFPEPFRNLDILKRESIEIFLRSIVGQMRHKDPGSQKEGLLQFFVAQFLRRPVGGDAVGVIIYCHVCTQGPPINSLRPSSQGRP